MKDIDLERGVPSCIFQRCLLKRQHSKKGKFVSSNAAWPVGKRLWKQLAGLHIPLSLRRLTTGLSSLKSRGRYRQVSQSAVLHF